jgi:hypothetical protein
MTVYDNPTLLMLLAFVILAVAFSMVFKHFKEISIVALMSIGSGLAIFGALYVGGTVVGIVMEHRTMEKCMTAHERRAKAYAAPDDYFGKQLREAAMEEAKTCAELAARKEAVEQAKK